MYGNQGQWKEAKELEVQVVETWKQAWRRESHLTHKHEPCIDLLKPGSVEGSQGAAGAGDGDEEAGAWQGESRLAHRHEQPHIHILGLGQVERSQEAVSASDGDDEMGAQHRAS